MRRPMLTRWSTACLLVASLSTGCHYGAYFLRPTHRPMQGLEARVDAGARRSCLIVMMPGMLNTPDDYFAHGFVADALAASRHCDVVAVDAHFGYYRDRTLAQQVGRDILWLADRRGYEQIWLVGSSLGGMGALMVARENPELVDGVVLFAPFFGDEGLVASIVEAGGLAVWDAPSDAEPNPFEEDPTALWAWLRGYATHPARMPALYIGVGAQDGMRVGVELLTDHLPASHHGMAEGGHAWDTWRVLWRRLLVSPPWDPRGATPHFDGP